MKKEFILLNIASNFSNRYFPNLKSNEPQKHTTNVLSFKGQELMNPVVQQKLEQIGSEIEKAGKIVVLTHGAPDGDAVGSAAAMKNIVESKYPDKKVDVLIIKDIPTGYKCLKDSEKFEYINKNSDVKAFKARNYDLAIAVDCSEKKMMREGAEIFDSAKRKVKIDHHIDRENYADVNLTCEKAASASQVVLLLAESMKVPLNKDAASDIYMAIITDTQGFRYMNKPSDVFDDCSKLIKTGIDTRKIYTSSMDYMSKSAVKLYGDAFNKIQYSKDGKIAYLVDDESLNKNGVAKSDVKDIFSHIVGVTMPNIEGVEIALKLTSNGGKTSGSIRSNGEVAINKLAETYGGGGHEFAAGFAPVDKTPKQIIEDIINYRQNTGLKGKQ